MGISCYLCSYDIQSLDDLHQYCSNCGAVQMQYCPRCGRLTYIKDAICKNCGAIFQYCNACHRLHDLESSVCIEGCVGPLRSFYDEWSSPLGGPGRKSSPGNLGTQPIVSNWPDHTIELGATIRDPIAAHGVLFVATRSGAVNAFSERTGESFWASRPYRGMSDPINIFGNLLYFASGNTVIGLDVGNGTLRFKYLTDLQNFLVLIHDNTLVLYGLNSQGEECLESCPIATISSQGAPEESIKRFRLETNRAGNSPVERDAWLVGVDGSVYLVDRGFSIWQLSISAAKLSLSWRNPTAQPISQPVAYNRHLYFIGEFGEPRRQVLYHIDLDINAVERIELGGQPKVALLAISGNQIIIPYERGISYRVIDEPGTILGKCDLPPVAEIEDLLAFTRAEQLSAITTICEQRRSDIRLIRCDGSGKQFLLRTAAKDYQPCAMYCNGNIYVWERQTGKIFCFPEANWN
jgi:outer membrane protein assembly factor BamB